MSPSPDPTPARGTPASAPSRFGSRGAQLLAGVLLVALLGGVVYFNGRTSGAFAQRAAELEAERAAASGPDGAVEIGPQGFRYREVSAEAGIDFQHELPRLDPQLDPILPLVAAMGAAVSVVDVDRDGFQDLYTVSSAEGRPNALYRNLGDGRFQDVAPALGLADLNEPGTGVSMGSVWADVNGDGYEDLLLYKWGRPELFLNRGGTSFERVTQDAGLPDWVYANTATWLDYDRDGDLDLFLGGYFDEAVDLWALESTRFMPESFEYAENGGRNHLLRNEGDGTFADVTEAMGLSGTRWTLASTAADLRGTGYPDLLVANDYGVSEYWLNEAGERFREVGREAGIASTPKSGMNMAVGDIFNEGRQALFVTNISAAGQLMQGNDLWVPTGEDEDGLPRFTNMAQGAGVALGGWAFGAQFGDLNNDGTLDLFQTNGYLSGDPDRSYWYDMSKVAIGNETVIGDAKNWPPLDGRNLSGQERKHVWINDGMAGFRDVTTAAGVEDLHDGRSVALVDLWNRGVLDAVVAHHGGPLLVYRNEVAPGRHWIGFELEGAGENQSAIGARLRLRWDGREQVQEVSGGAGFSSQNQRRIHFGLGEVDAVDELEITWPSGEVQTIEAPELDRYHRIVEPGAEEGEG